MSFLGACAKLSPDPRSTFGRVCCGSRALAEPGHKWKEAHQYSGADCRASDCRRDSTLTKYSIASTTVRRAQLAT